MRTKKAFDPDDIRKMAPLEKIGICATVNPNGLPNMTFVNSLMARDARSMTIGQFVRGKSKWFMQKNPNVAFFIFSLMAKRMWLGRARWTHKREEGPELERYKEMPMQRYNSYFPIHRVHYLDLVETTPALAPPAVGIVASSVLTKLAGRGAATRIHDRILKPYAEELFNRMTTLKFISFVEKDGFPDIRPFVQCMASDSRRLAFSTALRGREIKRIPVGADVAVFCLSTTLESVLTRGKFRGYRKTRGIRLGIIDIDWVYNSMPPNAGRIYPEAPLEPVVEF